MEQLLCDLPAAEHTHLRLLRGQLSRHEKLRADEAMLLVNEHALARTPHHAVFLVGRQAFPEERLLVHQGHNWHLRRQRTTAAKQLLQHLAVGDTGQYGVQVWHVLHTAALPGTRDHARDCVIHPLLGIAAEPRLHILRHHLFPLLAPRLQPLRLIALQSRTATSFILPICTPELFQLEIPPVLSSGAPSTRAPAVDDVTAAKAPPTTSHVAPSTPHIHASLPATSSPPASCPHAAARGLPAACTTSHLSSRSRRLSPAATRAGSPRVPWTRCHQPPTPQSPPPPCERSRQCAQT
eukprot:2982720-Rhodomonas_salina.1